MLQYLPPSYRKINNNDFVKQIYCSTVSENNSNSFSLREVSRQTSENLGEAIMIAVC
jgi:hypothetical protein